MRRILIWDNFPLKNVGGASGYLYNIHEYLKLHPQEEIVFLSDVKDSHSSNDDSDETIPTTLSNHTNNLITKLKRCVPSCFKRLYWKLRGEIYQPVLDAKFFHIDQFRVKEYILPLDLLNEFDYIHFHLLPQFTSFYATYPNYKGKTILTSHCPCSWIDEMIETKSLLIKLFRQVGLRTESKAYELVDYIMFPCVEAREPYEKNFQLRRVFKKNEHKFFYDASSILDTGIDNNKLEKLSTKGIPEDAFVICYFGRHISVKGYDILKKVGMELLCNNPNLYFLCGGNGPIEPPKHERWIELGFVSNANEWMCQCDLYILPNKDTYFDLVLLEILRASLPVIISETGGNKYFKRLPEQERIAIEFFNFMEASSLSSIVQKFIDSKSMDENAYKEMAKHNRKLYLKYFTLDKYISRYLEGISNLS